MKSSGESEVSLTILLMTGPLLSLLGLCVGNMVLTAVSAAGHFV